MPYKSIGYISLLILLPSLLIESLDYFQIINGFDLRYQRDAILNGEWWRLLSGHFDHLGWKHLLLNAAFFTLLLYLFKPLKGVRKTFFLTLVSMWSISAMMWFFSPEIVWYVGLSGCLYSLLIYAMTLDSRYPLNFRLFALAVISIKILMEQMQIEFVMVSDFISGPVAVDSHLYGVLVGAAFVIISHLLSKFKTTSPF